MKKISVIGHFGFGFQCLDGQTVKTKIITEELENQLGYEQVLKIDTYGGLKTLFKSPFQVFSALKNAKNIIIFPAHNGLRVYAPLLSIFKKFFKNRKIHYVVIGGWLPEFIKDKKCLKEVLKDFDGIYVETNTMKKALESQGFSNVVVMPNCKNLNVLSEDELVYPEGIPYKLCTFSRVSKEKGIGDAVRVVTEVNEKLGYTAFTLDIYGQVDQDQTEWFENLKSTFPDFVKYGGLVPFDKSTEVLKDYFALLFPTYYAGEGFAGTLIDAFSAGVPVIASDWSYNSEIVEHGKTGRIYSLDNKNGLENILEYLIENKEKWNEMKKICLEKANDYLPSKVVGDFIKYLN